ILDPAAAAAWFHWGYVPTPSTLVRGVRAVSPGEVLLVEAERLRARRFWTPGTVVAGPGATAALRARLEAAASGGSDRAVVALSGGRVSSSLAAWRRNLRGAALTYSRPGLDARDRQESLRMVDEHDLSHQEAPVEGSPAVRVQAALDAMDVPLGDPSFVGDVWWAAGLERIVPHAAPVLVGHGGAALVEAPVTERIPQELFPSWVTHNETLKTPSRLQRLEAELHRVDRLATASRRVLRAPFARTELLEAADGLSDPVDWHRLARGSVPARVARRSGSRYAPPLDAWMRGPLNRWIEGLFFGGLSASGLLEAGRLRWVWYQHQLRIRDYGASLWRLAVIEHWCRSAFSGEEIRVERRRRRGTSFFA
ncbi:MAG: asparagine synthase-related protein, partial [Myxococcota bacterium]